MKNRRYFLSGLLTALPFSATLSHAQEKKTATYIVPQNVKKIRVRAFVGEKEVMDTNIRVVPGQKFILDAIEED